MVNIVLVPNGRGDTPKNCITRELFSTATPGNYIQHAVFFFLGEGGIKSVGVPGGVGLGCHHSGERRRDGCGGGLVVGSALVWMKGATSMGLGRANRIKRKILNFTFFLILKNVT